MNTRRSNVSRFLTFAMASTALVMTSCSYPSQEAVFTEVQTTTAEQTGFAPEYVEQEKSVASRIKDYLDGGLTADEAVKIALLNNQGLQASYERLGISRGELIDAGLLHNPVFEAEIHFEGGGIGKGTNLNILEEFMSVFQLPLRRKVAESALKATELDVTRDVLSLIYDTEAAYYSVQGAEQLYALKKKATDAGELSADLAKRQYKAGNITKRELLHQGIAYAAAIRSLSQSQLQLTEEREKLNVLLGLWGPEVNWTVQPELPSLPDREAKSEGLQSLAISRRPELLRAKFEIEMLAGELGITEDFRLLPSFILGFDFEGEDNSRAVPGPNLSFPIPIFNQGQGAVAQASARLREAQRNYIAEAVKIRSEVRVAYIRLAAARGMVLFDQKHLVPLSAGLVESTQVEFNAMLAGAYDLHQAKVDAIEAEASQIEALRDYWVAKSELEKAIGGKIRPEDETVW